MTVSSGFFNSQNHDRLYDAEQFSSVFDGVILDGVYQGVGDAFKVTAYSGANNTVIVGTGRAWFDHTWTVNDSQYSIVLAEPNTMLGRIDAIVLDIDRRSSVRKNSIKYIQGALSSAPEHPVLIKEELHNQYPLAYITVQPGESAPINQMYIENKVGTSDCPLVTGVLESMDSDMFTQQMEAKFDTWFEGIKSSLEGDIALNLQNQINKLKSDIADQAQLLPNDNVYDFAQNASASLSKLDKSDRGQTVFNSWFLPDGYVVTLCDIYDSNIPGVGIDISTPEGVSLGKTLIDKGTAIPSALEQGDLQIDSCSYISKDGDEYPVTYKIATSKWGYYSDSQSSDVGSGPYIDGFYVNIFSVSITTEHVVSIDTIGTSDKIDVGHPKIETNYAAKKSLSFMPAYLNDGSYVIGYYFSKGKQYAIDQNSGKIGAVKISPQGTITAVSGISSVAYNSVSFEPPLCYTDKTNSFIYLGTQPIRIGGNVATYKEYGKIYNTNLEDVTETLGIDTAIIDPSNILTYSSDRYFTKPDMKSYVKITGPTYEIQETKYYPPFMQVSFDMKGSAASSSMSYLSGLISNDEALAIILSSSVIRGAYIKDVGMSIYKDISSQSLTVNDPNNTFLKTATVLACSDMPTFYKYSSNKYGFIINSLKYSVRNSDYSTTFPLVGIGISIANPYLLMVSF